MFRAYLLRSSLLLLLGIASPALSQTARLEGGWYFNSKLERFERNRVIWIRDGQIASVGRNLADESPRKGEQIVRLTESDYILPGLVDVHAHYNVNLLGRRRRDETQVTPVIYLANGVTTTFTAGEYNPDDMMALRKRIEQGKQTGPRLVTSGPYFGRARAGWRASMSKEEIYREVDHWVRQGAGGFKAKLITGPHLKALIDRAHLHGLTVTGHLESGYRGLVNPKDAILLGIDRVEHFLGGETLSRTRPVYSTLAQVNVNSDEFREITQLFIKKGVYFDATLTAYGYYGRRGPEYAQWTDESRFFTSYVRSRRRPTRRVNTNFERIYQNKLKTVKAFFDAGGKITLGTDHFSKGEYLAGFSAHRELEAFVRAGIPAAKAIKIATLNGASALKLDKRTGSILAGKDADLFIVKGNPLKDIKRTRSVHTVVRGGRVYRTSELLKSVEGKMGPKDEREASRW